MPAPLGFNVIGFISAEFGLGVATRNTIRILAGRGFPVAIVDLPLDNGRSGRDRTFEHLAIAQKASLPYRINLIHLNPPKIAAMIKSRPPWLDLNRCLNVAVPFWELPELPPAWPGIMQAMDVVLCPSRFIENAFSAALAGPKPCVRHYSQTAFIPELRPDRGCFGLPERDFIVATSFDSGSAIDRKNPWGAIDAFRRAFRNGGDVRLVIKVNETCGSPESRTALMRLREYIAEDPRILIRDEPMSGAEVLSFYASCDAYISLHRSEGLGLGPLEAMQLGKPVVTTAWSGVMDFITDTNACPVNCRLVPVTSPVYCALLGGKTTVWADPDLDHAALWLHRLHADPALRNSIGARACSSMVKRHEKCKEGQVFEAVLEMAELKTVEVR